jgi:hypothetical protein
MTSRVGANLHKGHCTLCAPFSKGASYWGDSFQVFDDLSPVVSTTAVLIPIART